jgi:spermidine synthase
LMLPTGKPGNIVVFGFKSDYQIKAALLRERAKALEAQFEKPHAIEFVSFVEKLCDHNSHNNQQFFTESS